MIHLADELLDEEADDYVSRERMRETSEERTEFASAADVLHRARRAFAPPQQNKE